MELIAGKNRSSVVAAILQNDSILKKAYSDAFNSEGSADKELENQLNSIEGRISQFNNALQTMWMNFISDDVVKGIVDIGTAAVKLADSLGFLPTVLGGFSAFKIVTNEVSSALNGEQSVLNKLGKELADFVNKKRAAAIASQEQMTADAAGAATSETNAQANRDQAQSNEQVAKAAQQQSTAVDNAAKSDVNEAATSETNAQANRDQANAGTATGTVLGKIGTGISSFALGLGKAALAMAAIKAVSWVLEKAWGWVDKQIHRVEYLREEVKELTDTYESAKSTFDDNLETLTVSSDTKSYATLLDEFEELTKGVNAYGENISLTSEQYARYQAICEDICGINPSLKSGYDSVTSAIGNNASALENLIELQKIQARQNAQEYVSDENIGKIFEDRQNQYEEIYSNIKIPTSISYATKIDNNGKEKSGYVNQIDSYIESAIGVKKGKWDSTIDYIIKNADLIRKNMPSILDIAGNDFVDDDGQRWKALTQDQVDELYQFLNKTISDIAEYKNGMVDTFLQVPSSMAEYESLSGAEKSFITDWINSGLFTIDENTTESMILEQKSKIKQLVRSLANDDYTTEIEDGTTISASDVLDSIYNFDTSNVKFDDYKTRMQELVDLLWDSIGGENNTLDIDDKNALAVQLGIKFVVEDEDSEINTFKTRVAELTNKSEDEIQTWINSLPVNTVEAMVKLDLSAQSTGITLEDIESMVTPIAISLPVEFKTYSTLSESIKSLNEALETSNELFADGAKTTEDYFESLVKLGIDKDKLSEAIDPSEYIVTDAAKLQELIKAQKEELAIEIKLGKAQAQLQYSDVIQGISDQIASTNVLENANKELVDSLFDQADTLRTLINQYQLLENSLLGATNAFTKFADAQDMDSQNTYGSTLVEMSQTMYDAIYKTGEVGSAQFWAAVKATVPDDIYAGLTPGNEQISAIKNYLKDNLFSDLTFDGDSFSIDFDSIEDFVKKAQSKGLFSGSGIESFGVSSEFMLGLEDGEDALKKFADEMGVTEAYIYAMFSEMDKYNANGVGLSMLFELDSSTTSQLTILNTKLEQALATRKQLMEQGADLTANTAEIYGLQAQQAGVKKQITEDTSKYLMVTNALEDPTKLVGDMLSKELIIEIGLQGKEGQTVESVFQNLSDYLLQFDEPLIYNLEISQDSIQKSISEFESEFGKDNLEENLEILNGETEGSLTIDESTLKQYEQLLNVDQLIGDALSENFTTTETFLSEIAENTAIMAGKETLSETEENSGVNSATADGGEASESGGVGRSDNTTEAQSYKSEVYDIKVQGDVDNFMDDLAKKKIELQNEQGFSLINQLDIDAIDKLQEDAKALKDKFHDWHTTEDLRAQLSELQTEAAKLGVELSPTLVVDQDAVGEEMPVVVDIPIEKMPVVIDVPIDLAETYENYKKDLEELGQLGFNPFQTSFGNINTNDRQVLEWDENNLNKYKEALMSWYDDMSWGDIVNDFSGTLSTVMGSSAEYDGVEIAFSPMLQTENGPVLLDRNAVDEYIWQLIDTANAQFGEGNWTGQDLINLDAQGLEFYGQIIKGLLADVGETAIQTGEAMHYVGTDGSIAQSYKIIEDAAQEAGISVDEMITRLEGGENITITAEADTGSAEKAGQEIGDAAQDATGSVTVGSNTGTNNDNSLNNPDNMAPKSVKTYSQLESDFESLNSVLSQTEEIIGNGTEVTQSYKETLAELLDVEVSDLGEYFEEGNELVVKNADGLKKLVKQAKNTTKQNVKLAKSQAKLEYYDLYKDLKQLTSGLKYTSDGYAILSDGQRAQINSLYEEMNAVRGAIAQFSMLETQLLGTTNAYTKFAEAQTLDSENNYSEQAASMVQIFADALNTGDLGTSAAREAMLALVPEEVYADLDTFEEKMDAVAKYFNEGAVSKYFSIDFDDDGNVSKVETTVDDLKQFVADGVKNGVFTGDWEHFDIAEDITSLEQFAEKMGITEDVAFALFEALENHDAGNLFDPSNILEKFVSGNIEYQAYRNAQSLAELEYQLANGAITAEEYNKKLLGLDGQLAAGIISQEEYNTAIQSLKEQLEAGTITQQDYNEAVKGLSNIQAETTENAYKEVTAYTEKSAALEEAKNKLEEYNKKLEETEDPIERKKIEKDIEATTNEINTLIDELSKLEEPTDIVIGLAIEYVEGQIDDVEEDIKQLAENTKDPVTVTATIETKLKEVEDSGFDLSQFGLTKDESGNWTGVADFVTEMGLDPNADGVMETVTSYLNLVDQQHTLELLMGSETDDVVTTLQSINTTLQAIATKLGVDYTLDVDTKLNTDPVTTFLNTPLSKTISVTMKKVGNWLGGLFANGTVHANGTAHMSGTAHATGSWGAPKTETALVGELGPELV